MTRPSIEAWGLALARVASTRGTCLRRRVGCVLLDARGDVLGMGYNGVHAGAPHCNKNVPHCVTTIQRNGWESLRSDPGLFVPTGSIEVHTMVDHYPHACRGAHAASGTDLDACEAIHAEANALLRCRDIWAIRTCCTTTSPCLSCVKLLLNTSCERIVFNEEYPHTEARERWERAGRSWEKVP